MKFKELATKSETELHKLLSEFRTQQRELRFKVASDQQKNIRQLRTVRKNIAQILMLLNSNKKQTNTQDAQ